MSRLNILVDEQTGQVAFISWCQVCTALMHTMASGCTSDYNAASASSLENAQLHTLCKLKTATLVFVDSKSVIWSSRTGPLLFGLIKKCTQPLKMAIWGTGQYIKRLSGKM